MSDPDSAGARRARARAARDTSATRSASTPTVERRARTTRAIRGVLEGDDLGLFIGRHGQTIDAVQHLAFKVANRDGRPRRPCASSSTPPGYRERREQVLHRQADQAAADAVARPAARSRSTR